ncbi:MAG: phosphotransferase [Planctomycetota bacterium]
MQRIQECLREQGEWRGATVEAMAGDASTRRFYRAHRSGEPETAVLMVYEPEESDAAITIFLETAAFFRSASIRVPEIYFTDRAHGMVLLEDLGRETMQDALRRDPSARELYEQALRWLGCLWNTWPSSGPVACRRLDQELFAHELEHMLRWLVGAHLQLRFPDRERAIIIDSLRRLASELSAQPLVACHRDYHSRNIVCGTKGLGLVDFQDARLGPYTYDLASLAYDAYVDPGVVIRQWLEACLPSRPLRHRERDLAVAVLQRSLKAAGTFAFQAASRGRPAYLASLPPVLAYADHAAKRLGAFPVLETLIQRCREALACTG